MPAPIGSVVIPAHNEAAVIDRCLSRLAPDGERDLEIVVVANACTDDTAQRAAARGVRVVETARGGKAHALDLGDRACSAFPRIYLDADVELARDAALALIEVMRVPGVLAAAPALRWAPDGLPWPVRAYYRAWTAMPYTSDGMLGSGVYALSEDGRRRFGGWPDIISDDGFVQRLFARHERRTPPGATFTVHPPTTVRALIGIKARVWAGNQQLRAMDLPIVDGRPPGGLRRRAAVLADPLLWPALPVYALVYALSRVLGRWRLRTGRLHWTRDLTSRRGPAPTTRPHQ